MDRRWWGAAVVAAVLLSALVLPGIAGTRLTGAAQRAPIPGPPSVGFCLSATPAGNGGPFDSPKMRVLTGPVGPCDDANFGEVVSVQDVETFRGSSTDRMAVLDPAACELPAAQYLGWAGPAPGAAPAEAAGWLPVALQNLVLFGPGDAQYSVGQRWISCVLLPGLTPYPGSVRGTEPGPAVDAFGTCRAGANNTASPHVPCSEPHVSEVVGVGSVESDQVPELVKACRELFSREARLSDPTAGGALSIWVEAGGSFGDPPQGGNAGSTPGRCTVSATGGRQLDASLLGVGDGPLPLVP